MAAQKPEPKGVKPQDPKPGKKNKKLEQYGAYNPKKIKIEHISTTEGYSLNLCTSTLDPNKKILVANIHFDSGADLTTDGDGNKTRKELHELLKLMHTVRDELILKDSSLKIDDFVVGGDLNAAVVTGPVEDEIANERKRIDVITNREALFDLLNTEAIKSRFSCTVYTSDEAVDKTRIATDITRNNQAAKKSGKIVQDTQIVIQGKFNSEIPKRTSMAATPADSCDLKVVMFDVMSKEHCVDHRPVSTKGLKDTYGTEFSFMNVLETKLGKGEVKGISANKFDPIKFKNLPGAGDEGAINKITAEWSKTIGSLVKKIFGTTIEPTENIAEIEKKVNTFLEKFYGLLGTGLLRSALKIMDEASHENIQNMILAKIKKKFDNNEPFPTSDISTMIGEVFSRQQIGGFELSPASAAAFEKSRSEHGPRGLTEEIEYRQAMLVKQEAEKKGSVVFLCENRKEIPFFKACAEEPNVALTLNYNYARFEEIFKKLGQNDAEVKSAMQSLHKAQQDLIDLQKKQTEPNINEAVFWSSIKTFQDKVTVAEEKLNKIFDTLQVIIAVPKPDKGMVMSFIQGLDNLFTITGDSSLKLEVAKFRVEAKFGSPNTKGLEKLKYFFLKAFISVLKLITDALVTIKAYAYNTGYKAGLEGDKETETKGFRQQVHGRLVGKRRP